ncbi:HutD/Ves family protein [Roseovarius sp. ZX-A-9]|uniref:HutD/Ves family protein n=1 Tax=Roseovarius sp. ZX-A-9 TaxID=3014783 RepID=UPI00232E78AC|nr:HutD family protein [Roseovarius sp. ZX-A-9]
MNRPDRPLLYTMERPAPMDILRCSNLIDIPWKNDGGVTREIATATLGDRMAWRISRADVGQDGAFSDFSGVMRILTVVEGGGVDLEHAGGVLNAPLWEPVRFDGGLSVYARLTDGPLTDLNLMFDPAICAGEVIVHRGPSRPALAPVQPGMRAFHGLAGVPEIDGESLAPGDTAFVGDAGTAPILRDGDAALEIRISYLDQSAAIKLAIAAR